jgi:hypothetical protein
LLLLRYSFFIEFAGREDLMVQKETQTSNEGSGDRTAYGVRLNISAGQEEEMLSIVLGASSKVIDLWDQNDALCLSLVLNGQTSEIPGNPRLKPLQKSLLQVSADTRSTLKQRLGAAFIDGLDAYVYREFVNRFGPRDGSEDRPSPSRISDSPAGLDGPDWTELGYFSLLFQSIDHLEQQGLATKERSSAKTETLTQLHFPLLKQQMIAEILQEAGHRLLETDGREQAAIGIYHRDFGPQPVPHPLPDNLVRENRAFWAIVEDGVSKLKEALSAQDFNKLESASIQIFSEKPEGIVREIAATHEIGQ